VTLTPPKQLVPGVFEDGERLVYKVKSRSSKTLWRVDFEAKHGLGKCDCPDYRINKNPDCFHIQQARKYLTVCIAQAVIKANHK